MQTTEKIERLRNDKQYVIHDSSSRAKTREKNQKHHQKVSQMGQKEKGRKEGKETGNRTIGPAQLKSSNPVGEFGMAMPSPV